MHKMEFLNKTISLSSELSKPTLIILSEPQSYQLLLVGLAVLGALIFWENYSK